ncbi:hypothetical protein [Dyadobacter psychrophilus]|uniref:Regulation of enolase protein 1, concanavalin A-like superfamily n=1 Tax=Dyadobacter psychrophilus TaxID=651661 RepID=A0A1T5DWT0_9BACT|nr:hypothetical protein [Dyadobacter psychrophilus]SKB76124.1 hypothetical protein SAMN05660293_01966 [Dyadobacter psychrophilus]
MNQRFYLPILLFFTVITGFSPSKTGLFEQSADIGNPKLAGSAKYDASTKQYTLKGAGYNIWFERDEFQYLFNKMVGDFTVTADFEFVGTGKDPHRKVGWVVRESMADDASHLSAVLHGDGLSVLQWRVAKGKMMRDPEDEIFSKDKNFQTIQIERKGNNYTMRAAAKGAPLQEVGSHEMDNLNKEVMVGLFICSHNPAVLEEAKFSNVTISKGKK